MHTKLLCKSKLNFFPSLRPSRPPPSCECLLFSCWVLYNNNGGGDGKGLFDSCSLALLSSDKAEVARNICNRTASTTWLDEIKVLIATDAPHLWAERCMPMVENVTIRMREYGQDGSIASSRTQRRERAEFGGIISRTPLVYPSTQPSSFWFWCCFLRCDASHQKTF